MKPTPLKRYKGIQSRKVPAKRRSGANLTSQRKIRQLPNKGYRPPQWFNSIPTGSHGNTPAQKRYWTVVSGIVRQRDFNKYKGKCVSCPRRLESWKQGQAAHYKPWSVCNGYFKYELTNLALSCPHCNHISSADIGHNFGEALKSRYGEDHLDWIEKENQKHSNEKMETHDIVQRVEKLLEENPWYICP